MNEIQNSLDELYSQLFGSIVIPNSIVEQEEEDAKILMSLYGYDKFKYEEVNYD